MNIISGAIRKSHCFQSCVCVVVVVVVNVAVGIRFSVVVVVVDGTPVKINVWACYVNSSVCVVVVVDDAV